MAASEFLERRGLYLFEDPPISKSSPVTMCRFLAVFVAGFESDNETIALRTNRNEWLPCTNQHASVFRGLDPGPPSPLSDGGEKDASPDPPVDLHFGISFLIPESMAPRIMLPGRFSVPNDYDIGREHAVLAVDIGHWSFLAPHAARLKPHLTDPLSNRLGSQLTFSEPSSLRCMLLRWPQEEDTTDLSQSEPVPVLVQEASCSIMWQSATRGETADRVTLLPPLAGRNTAQFFQSFAPEINVGITPVESHLPVWDFDRHRLRAFEEDSDSQQSPDFLDSDL